MLLTVVFLGASLLACTSESKDVDADAPSTSGVCTPGFAGDPSRPIELQLIALGADRGSVDVGGGDALDLIAPPQGGRVVFVGIRARNLDPCPVELLGALSAPTTGEVRLDRRMVKLVPSPDGWFSSKDSSIATFANIPVCPNLWSLDDVLGKDFALKVTVVDSGDRTASIETTVTVACNDPADAEQCQCICKPGYIFGQPCGDAGSP